MHSTRSAPRGLALLAPNLMVEYPELVGLGVARGWRIFPELGAIQIRIDETHDAEHSLLGFLRSVINPARLEGLRAAWTCPEQSLDQQLHNLIHANPLPKLLAECNSPLPDLLKENRIETWFQPIFHRESLEVWGYECLVRGRSAQGELIGAGQLLRWGQLDNLTLMLDRACREAHFQNAGRSLPDQECRVLVNFIPTAANTAEFCLRSTVESAMREGLHPGRIIFELVETERIPNPHELREVLDEWRRAGFGIALDDVGSGYSSLAVLGDLAPDLIKIDRHLIARSVHSVWHRDMCAFLVRLAHDNGKLVLAEGVETREELHLALSLGVDLLQGFLLGQPAPEPARASMVPVRASA